MSRSIYTVTLNPGLDRTLTVPSIEFNGVLRATESRLDWGGKGFNVSRALQALGSSSIAMGFVGGAIGKMLDHGLCSLDIETDFVWIEGETRTNTVVQEAGSERYLKVNEAGPTVGQQAVEELLEIVRHRADPDSVWVLSGSLPPGAPTDIYARMVGIIEDGGGLAFLDASGEALRQGLTSKPYLVKPNFEEAKEMLGQPSLTIADAPSIAARFLNLGAQRVALSMGADGLLLADGEVAVQARPPQMDVQTVVGVGDALVAGLVYATVHGFSLGETAAWGVAAGTAAALGAGTSVGSRATIERLVEQIAFAPDC